MQIPKWIMRFAKHYRSLGLALLHTLRQFLAVGFGFPGERQCSNSRVVKTYRYLQRLEDTCISLNRAIQSLSASTFLQASSQNYKYCDLLTTISNYIAIVDLWLPVMFHVTVPAAWPRSSLFNNACQHAKTGQLYIAIRHRGSKLWLKNAM